MITVIISTSNRLYYLKKTINDLAKLSQIIDQIIIYSFNDLKTENYIKNRYKKKFKKIITLKSRNNFEIENRIKHLSDLNIKLTDNSKYVWFMSDKDRILLENHDFLKMILKKNISGLTMDYHSLKKPFSADKNRDKIFLFNLEKGVHKLGLISSQIINKRLFIKYSKKSKLSAYYLGEIIVNIIIKEKKWFFLNSKIIGYTHLDKDKIRNKLNNKYLNYRLEQEFSFYILKLNKILSIVDYPNKYKIIKKAFFKNVISWLFLYKKEEDKLIYSKKIFKLNQKLVNFKVIKLILFFSILIPNFLIDMIKKIIK